MSAFRCISIGRGPSSHPPGSESLTAPVRARTAPKKIIELLVFLIRTSGMSFLHNPSAVMSIVV